MYPQQYPSVPSAPPPAYNGDAVYNQQQYSQSMPNYYTTSEDRMAGFQQIVDRYESKFEILIKFLLLNINYLVNYTFAKKLRALEGYEIVFICDDSGSMNTPLGKQFIH